MEVRVSVLDPTGGLSTFKTGQPSSALPTELYPKPGDTEARAPVVPKNRGHIFQGVAIASWGWKRVGE